MLVNKKYEAKSIVSFKLVNGDELVARVLEQNTNEYIIENPCLVVPAQNGVHLIQAMFSGDINTTIPLNFNHVMIHVPTAKVIADHYLEVVTGIKTVNKGGIIF